MSERRVIRFRVVPLATIDRELAQPRFCRNCGDPFDADAEAAALRQPHGAWRPCPNPSPGRPLVDCGIGGHMYSEAAPRCS